MAYAFVASETSVAQRARRKLMERYGDAPPEQAEAISALGDDGYMLRTLHAHLPLAIPGNDPVIFCNKSKKAHKRLF